jgi:hypothetical protein
MSPRRAAHSEALGGQDESMRIPIMALLLLGLGGPVWAKPCVAPTRSEFAGAWVADDASAFYRLELDERGDGVLVSAIGASPHQTYDVSLAKLDSRRVEFRVTTISSLEKTLFLRGSACRGHLYLELGSQSPRWKADLEFKLLEPLLERIRATSETVQRLKTGAKR